MLMLVTSTWPCFAGYHNWWIVWIKNWNQKPSRICGSNFVKSYSSLQFPPEQSTMISQNHRITSNNHSHRHTVGGCEILHPLGSLKPYEAYGICHLSSGDSAFATTVSSVFSGTSVVCTLVILACAAMAWATGTGIQRRRCPWYSWDIHGIFTGYSRDIHGIFYDFIIFYHILSAKLWVELLIHVHSIPLILNNPETFAPKMCKSHTKAWFLPGGSYEENGWKWDYTNRAFPQVASGTIISYWGFPIQGLVMSQLNITLLLRR